MQLDDFADWQSQNGDIGQNIDDAVSIPKGSAVGAMRIFDSLVPKCCDWNTLEDGGKQGADRPANNDKQICETEVSENVANEHSKVQKENRDLIKAEDQLVEDLRQIEPL